MPYYEPTASSARYICMDMEDGETAPFIGGVSPGAVPLLQAVTLTIDGKGFRPGDVVRIGILDIVPTEVSNNRITVGVLGAVLAGVGLLPVRVVRGSFTTPLINLSVTL